MEAAPEEEEVIVLLGPLSLVSPLRESHDCRRLFFFVFSFASPVFCLFFFSLPRLCLKIPPIDTQRPVFFIRPSVFFLHT